jgi:5-methylcytosine-specific restriction endonuclease McrA
MSAEQQKICTKCKVLKLLSFFYKNKRANDGLYHVCIPCQKLKAEKYRLENQEMVNAYKREWAHKNKEKEAARHSEYYQANKESISKYKAQYNIENRAKLSASRATYFAENPAKKAEYYARYVAKNPDKVKAETLRYYHANKELIAARKSARLRANPEKFAAYFTSYRKNNPEKCRAIRANRRAQKKCSDGTHNGNDIKQLLVAQKHKCVVCRRCIKRSYHVDHIQPLAKGGSNGRLNLQLLCPTCNQKKSKKDPILFMQERGFLL